MAHRRTIEEFFQGTPIKYEANLGNLQADLTIQHQAPSGWKHGIDHLCYADLSIRYAMGCCGQANRNPSLTWNPGYLHVASSNPLYFDGLFEQIHEMAPDFVKMLTHMSSVPSVHLLRRIFDSLEDKFRGQFDDEQFIKQFIRAGSQDSDD